jgi:PEP-CTERM motif
VFAPGVNPGVLGSAYTSGSINGVATTDRIFLGNFTYTGVSVGQTLTITALPGLGPDNVLGDGVTDIDSYLLANTTSALITVTAVPEPGTMVLGGLLATGILGGYLRRLRKPVIA